MTSADWEGRETPDFPIGTLLRFLYSAVAREEEHFLSAAGYDTVHIAHFPILKYLYTLPEGVRITDLATWAHITKPSMIYLVNALAEQGYVERVSHTSDKRTQIVRLTDRGQAAAAVLQQINLAIEQRWQKYYGLQAVSQMKGLLQKLAFMEVGDQEKGVSGQEIDRNPIKKIEEFDGEMPGAHQSRYGLATHLVQWLHCVPGFLRRQNQNTPFTASQANVLCALMDGKGRRIHELASVEGVRSSSMTELITRMSQQGWITRGVSGDGDNRGVEVAITPAGLAQISQVIEQEQQQLDQKFAILSGEEIEAIKKALPVMQKLFCL